MEIIIRDRGMNCKRAEPRAESTDQESADHYYLERSGMLSVNGRSSVRSRARSHAGRKLRLRKSVLNDCTQSRGEKRLIWCALNVGSILVVRLIANEYYQDSFYFLSFLSTTLDFLPRLRLRLRHRHRFHYSLVPLTS